MFKLIVVALVFSACSCQVILNNGLTHDDGQYVVVPVRHAHSRIHSYLSPQAYLAPQVVKAVPKIITAPAHSIYAHDPRTIITAPAPIHRPVVYGAHHAVNPVVVAAPAVHRPVVLAAPEHKPIVVADHHKVILRSPHRQVLRVDDEHYGPAEPYTFGFHSTDEMGNIQSRQETSDGQGVRGSYSYADDKGLNRIVDYVADAAGYRASVRTNEPGTANADPADVQMAAEETPANVQQIVAAYSVPKARVI